MVVFDEYLNEEIEVQEEITPDTGLEMKLKSPQIYAEIGRAHV